MTSADYKAAAANRGLDVAAQRELRLARMSRLVWVVEAIDRIARDGQRPSVVAEIVFDATSSDIAPNALAIRVPGALLIQQTDGTIRSPLPATRRATSSAGRSQP